ncbi:TetR/AcrR family transcriptional regulator [Paenibacillus sp. NEAU-GSW1]|uniref:TetR/AcrR family transcriptional regulator n=1 Tax=Paenibacillus sp. NEAU-GSW1 TaxID=2682486 RepID=UPI00139AFE92|nr:TetR family transcriptional regulator [Paenibacillus sp. NEAU-GSW1]
MSPRNVAKDQQLREVRREQILDCSLQLIAKRGLDSVGMKDIANEAGVSVGNMYNYFKAKDDIISAVLERGQVGYGRMVAEMASIDKDAREKLYDICAGWIATPKNWAFTIMLQSIRTNEMANPDLREAATRRFTANLQPMADIMRQGQQAGVLIDGDPQQLAFYFVSLIQGLTLQLAPGYEIPVEIQAESIVRLFCAEKNSLTTQ